MTDDVNRLVERATRVVALYRSPELDGETWQGSGQQAVEALAEALEPFTFAYSAHLHFDGRIAVDRVMVPKGYVYEPGNSWAHKTVQSAVDNLRRQLTKQREKNLANLRSEPEYSRDPPLQQFFQVLREQNERIDRAMGSTPSLLWEERERAEREGR
jgi:hypothetical protein